MLNVNSSRIRKKRASLSLGRLQLIIVTHRHSSSVFEVRDHCGDSLQRYAQGLRVEVVESKEGMESKR